MGGVLSVVTNRRWFYVFAAPYVGGIAIYLLGVWHG
jgi:hypothetical protein